MGRERDEEFRKNYAALQKALSGLQEDPARDPSVEAQLLLDISNYQARGPGLNGMSLEEAVRAALVYRSIRETGGMENLQTSWDRDGVMEHLSAEVKKALDREGLLMVDPVKSEPIKIHPFVFSQSSNNETQRAVMTKPAQVLNPAPPPQINGNNPQTPSNEIMETPPNDNDRIFDIRLTRGQFILFGIASALAGVTFWQWETIANFINPEGYSQLKRKMGLDYESKNALRQGDSGALRISYPLIDLNKWEFGDIDEKYKTIVKTGNNLIFKMPPSRYSDSYREIRTNYHLDNWIDPDGKRYPRISWEGIEAIMNGDKYAPEGSIASIRPDVVELTIDGRPVLISIKTSEKELSEFEVDYVPVVEKKK